MEIGEHIRLIRNSKGITQRALAYAIHVTPSFMNHIEKGISSPSLEHICNIANALEVTPQDVLCDLFVFPETDCSIPEKIKHTVEKLPIDKQQELLDVLEFLVSRQ